jgi:hypothetical protein
MRDLRFPHWKERLFTHQHLVHRHTQGIDVRLFRWDPFVQTEFGREDELGGHEGRRAL